MNIEITHTRIKWHGKRSMVDMWKFISKDGSIEKDATGRQNRIKKDFIMNGGGLGYYRSLAAVGS